MCTRCIAPRTANYTFCILLPFKKEKKTSSADCGDCMYTVMFRWRLPELEFLFSRFTPVVQLIVRNSSFYIVHSFDLGSITRILQNKSQLTVNSAVGRLHPDKRSEGWEPLSSYLDEVLRTSAPTLSKVIIVHVVLLLHDGLIGHWILICRGLSPS